MSRAPQRPTILNPRRGGIVAALRWLLWLTWMVVLAGGAGTFAAYVALSRDLPRLEALVHYRPRQARRVVSADGFLLAVLGDENRRVVPPERIPVRLRQAFIAAEDAAFYQHPGIDAVAVLRAVVSLVRRRVGGGAGYRQGGSTITQQLARSLLSREKTMLRKAREAILALRLEAVLSKDQILWTYLNEVYLGRRAYGVAAAARAYFDTPLRELDLGQMAYLAGLPQQPSALARDHEAAVRRAGYVLGQMVARGWAGATERDAVLEGGISLTPGQRPNLLRAPGAVQAAVRAVETALGPDAAGRNGAVVETTVLLTEQLEASAALDRSLSQLDRRQGQRPALARLDREQEALLRTSWESGALLPPRGPEGLTAALVESVERKRARLRTGGAVRTLELSDHRWARPWDPAATRNRGRLRDLRKVLRSGDVVAVREAAPQDGDDEGKLSLVSWPPGVQGAVLVAETGTGYRRVHLGSRDFDLSTFDHLRQACRQPGSIFKPVYYTAGLAAGLTPATVVVDAPLALEQQDSAFAYRARNADRRYRGDMLLADALAQSRNVPSLKVFRHVGAAEALRWAARLGITSPLAPVDALALGASCVHPEEMASAYGVFAEGGLRRAPLLLRTVRLPSGELLLDRRHASDPGLDAAAALRKTLAHVAPARALTPELAYLTTALLRGVVERGTARKARSLTHPVAGKTGTTDSYDAWFAGFSAARVGVVWVGPGNNERVLGRGEHGGRVALPVLADLLEATQQDLPVRQLPGPAPPGVEWLAIDPSTGLRAARRGRARRLPFLVGTAPEELSTGPTGVSPADADRMSGRF